MILQRSGSCRIATGIALILVQQASSWNLASSRPGGIMKMAMSGYDHEHVGSINKQQPSDHRILSIAASRVDAQDCARSSSSLSSSMYSGNDTPLTLTRADWLRAGAGVAAIAPVVLSQRDTAAAALKTGAVTVFGAGGKTGRECVEYLANRGAEVRAVARSLTDKEGRPLSFAAVNEGMIALETADVTVPSSLPGVIQGSSAVIFASSASKQGGSAKAVDYEGVVNVAKACLSAKVPRLVVVSSGGVATPESAVYKFLNLFGEIMAWKIRGEDELRAMYAAQGPDAACHYTIVRPGGLTLDPPRGVATIELNQGDTKSGRIARSDVARVCVEAIYSPKAEDCTLECYYKDTAKPLDTVGLSNILKQTTKEGAMALGTESTGDTWDAIFSGLKRDA